MPEVEKSRDPLGAGRGKTIRQHADSISYQIKKHIHDKYYIPPYRPVNRNWEITFASLGWKRRTIQKFWRLFCQVNVSRDGSIKLNEFLAFFNLDWTPWTERCFAYFDTTGGGDIDFLEFMISMWNVCTFKIDTLSNFAFDMYDLDLDGELSIPEIEQMVDELYGENGGQKCLSQITQYAEERGGALSLHSFIAFTATHQSLLFPMFLIQQKLQRKVFGRKFWQSVDRKSKTKKSKGANNQADSFNPRHVQVLLRTYQTGGAAAVLSHTGDPNKGLRDWYENQKREDITEQSVNKEERPSLQKWQSIKHNIRNVGANPQARRIVSTVNSFRSRQRENSIDQVANVSAIYGNFRGSKSNPVPSAPPRECIEDKETNDAININRPRTASAPPQHVTDALKRIREKRSSTPVKKDSPSKMLTPIQPKSRPGSARTPPPEVAAALNSIRAKRASILETSESQAQSTGSNRPNTAGRSDTANSPPSDVTEALRNIRAKRRSKANPGVDVTPKRKSRHRKRNSNMTPNNVRQRQAGTMFVSTGQSDGWLE